MRIISGIQPTGKMHLGNFFGAVKQFLELQHQDETFFFVADLHALTTMRDAKAVREMTDEIVKDYLALGLDPSKTYIFRQSDIPEVTELLWYLMTVTPVSMLDNAPYKDKVAHGVFPGTGLMNYPVLMAADILLYGADVVPVGKDQIHHLEIARDIAMKFNMAYVPGYEPSKGNGILKLPKARMIGSEVIPGIDGRKMSKSLGNVIEIFASDAEVKKKIMSIVTDSTPVEASKDLKAPLYSLMSLFTSWEEQVELEDSFKMGGVGYGTYKQKLLEMFHSRFREAREMRPKIKQQGVNLVLNHGRSRAREVIAPILQSVRKAVLEKDNEE